MADFTDDLDILNYALTLEHFESAMYKGIIASGKLTGAEQQYATDFGAHEAAHVTALTSTIQMLGGTPVQAQASYRFPAFDTRDGIVGFLVTVEDLGAGAYLAAAPEVKNPDVLTAAVAIHNVEGQHASIWRRAAKMSPIEGAFAAPNPRAKVLAAVTPFLAQAPAGTAAATAAGTARPATTTTAAAPATAAATATTAGTARPAATGAGGGVAATTAPAATATRPAAALPVTGAARPEDHTGTTAAVVAGLAAIGAGVLLRARSYKRTKTAN